MSPTDSREETLFAAALALPEAARAAYLDQACGGDKGLRASVEALLRAHLAADSFLPSAMGSARPTIGPAAAAGEEQPGDRIGRYKLLQQIGEGGCGVVYMAEQEEPVRRRVALKVIKLGMDTKAVVARFDAERQALAMMDHPNIAKVLDAGSTDSGRPFFVMELVRGIPVTKYCDDNGLATGKRLELFTQICHAIQHAHQKGIIHRDIKPSNILVVLHDGIPVPKVIDFGIAKATQGRLTDQTLFTAFEQFIGTPAYMSPEQAEMSGLDIDTRSDVYSLGVLLYELLSGRPPFDPKTFLSVGIDEMRRLIREVDPPKPSTRLSTLAEADQTTVAKLRGTAPAQLSTVLAGDLDWVVMRCLEKDRTRRYQTASALAADVQRHLANEPVAARPPSTSYRLQKFCRRNKTLVVAVAAVALVLVAGLIVSAAMYVRERAARQRAGAAEQAESSLRQQAETARTEEVKRAARTALDLANRNLADGRIADGLAYLVYAARKDPRNRTLGPRIASALASHNFLIPQAAPLACGSRVLALRFTSDGRSFQVGTEDGTFRVMDAFTGAVKWQFKTNREVVPDGWEFARFNDSVVAARFADNAVTLYDVATGKPKFPSFQLDPKVGVPESTRVIGLSSKGGWIYAISRNEFWVWQTDTGALRLHLNFPETIADCDFNPAEDTVALIVGKKIERWTLPAGQQVDTPITIHATPRMPYGAELRYSPDGSQLAAIEFSTAQVFDASTGTLVHHLPNVGSDLDPAYASFVTNDRLLLRTQSQYGWWDLSSDRFSPSALGYVLGASLNVSGKRGVARSSDGLLQLFDVGSSTRVIEPVWRQSAASCAAISPDGTQVLMGTADGLLYRFSVGHGAARPLVLSRTLKPKIPAPFLPAPPNRLLVPSGDHAKVVEIASGRELADFRFPEMVLDNPNPIHDTNPPIRSDAKFMAVRTASGWQSWELGDDGVRQIVPLQGAPNSFPMAAFSPGGDLLVLGDERLPRLWDLRTGVPVGQPLNFAGLPVPFSVSFNPDASRLALGARNGSAVIFDIKTGQPVLSLKTRRQVRTWSAQYSPDGERILTTSQYGESRLWNANTGEPVGPVLGIMGSADRYHRPVFSRDGRWVAVPFPKTVMLLDGRTGNEVGHRIPMGGKVVRFSPDGNRVGTADPYGHAQVWDVPSGEAITEPLRYPGGTSLPEFSPDGRFLKTEGTQVNLWAVPPPLPEGVAPPEWLLQLATLLASQVVNDAGQLVPATETANAVEGLRHQIATLPADAPLADWGRWVLDDRPDRPIAPGFTITPAEADQLVSDAKP